MLFRQITDTKLAQYAYLIGCQRTKEAIVIDPERDIDQYVAIAEREGLTITAVAETHIHADFLSGVRAFAEQYGTRVYVSDEGDADWKSEWAKDSDYDVVFLHDGDTFKIGNIELKAVHTPGHTPEHISYLVTDHGGGADEPIGIASGDFVFVGDLGRPDLLESAAKVAGMQEPSARRLFESLQSFLQLPDFVQVWPGHGAGSACGKALGAVPQSTVGYERQFNAAIDTAGRGEQAFVDAILSGQPEPPLYFARMKQLNKTGVPLLDALPEPRALAASDVEGVLADEATVVIDTRVDRQAFAKAHLPGSLYAPFNKTFNTAAGSVVTDPEAAIVLVIDETDVETAVRDLIRIGLDTIVGFVTPAELERYIADGGRTDSFPILDFADVDARRDEPGVHVLDVRYASEYDSRHIPGATNVSYTRLADRLADVPEGETLIVHCGSGARAAIASAYLAAEGYDVAYVDDAFANWAERHQEAEQTA